MDTLKLTEKQARVIEIMRAEDAPMFPAQIAEADPALFTNGAKSVSPIMISLGKAELVVKGKGTCEVVDKNGNSVTKELVNYSLSDAGRTAAYELK